MKCHCDKLGLPSQPLTTRTTTVFVDPDSETKCTIEYTDGCARCGCEEPYDFPEDTPPDPNIMERVFDRELDIDITITTTSLKDPRIVMSHDVDGTTRTTTGGTSFEQEFEVGVNRNAPGYVQDYATRLAGSLYENSKPSRGVVGQLTTPCEVVETE